MRFGGIVPAIGLAVLCMAPTAGDVGGCGSDVTALDRAAFARARKASDCLRCGGCVIRTSRCTRSCNPVAAPEVVIPNTCQPLDHDGEVCLRALRSASCEDYASFVADVAASTPTECAFCRTEPPVVPSPLGNDAAVEAGR